MLASVWEWAMAWIAVLGSSRRERRAGGPARARWRGEGPAPEEGIRGGDGLHARRQVRVHAEAHRHFAPLARLQGLGGEAEALGLGEVARGPRRRHRGHGAADDR